MGPPQHATESGRERLEGRERERRAAGEGRRSSRGRAQLRGKESTQRSGRPPLTSTRLKRALSLAGSCTQGITAMGRLAGPTSQDPGRGLPQRDATGSGTQRTPVGGPGGKSARAKMATRARPHAVRMRSLTAERKTGVFSLGRSPGPCCAKARVTSAAPARSRAPSLNADISRCPR